VERTTVTTLATQWTGANAAEVLAMLATVTPYTSNVWTVQADDGQALMLRETAPLGNWAPWPVQLGQWVVVRPDFGIIARLSNAAYQVRYKTTRDLFMEAAGDAGVRAALNIQQEVGAAAIGIILLGGSSTVNVTLTGAFPDTNYNVKVRAVAGTSVLSMLRVTNVVKTAGILANPATGQTMVPATVAVTLQAVGVASLAGVVLVDCLR
jgi:hypothetical protein